MFRRACFRIAIASAALAMAIPAVCLAQSDAPSISHQSGATLELSPSVGSQGSMIPKQPPGNQGNMREIPVIPPQDDVLVLPQASTDFLGRWGGWLQLAHKYGQLRPPSRNVVSLLFGQRDGNVVLATTVFGDPSSQVLKTKATSESPREVKIEIAGLDLSHQPAWRHVEKMTIELDGNNHLKCRKLVDIYVSGFTDPIVEAVYEGSLSPLTAAENRKLGEDVLREGVVPRGRIEEGNPPPE